MIRLGRCELSAHRQWHHWHSVRPAAGYVLLLAATGWRVDQTQDRHR